MKFAKTARDASGRLLNPGDILNVILKGSEPAHIVIRKIIQQRRDQFPVLRGTKVVTDWKGTVIKTVRVELEIDDYNQSVVVDPTVLRDGVPVNDKLKEIQFNVTGK